jgi:adenylylsulfate kinase-like enzyme
MIYVLYGQPGSGKTTLSKNLCDQIMFAPAGCDPVVLDGDEFRELFQNKDYSKEGRYQNIRNANAIATYSNRILQRDVILALVNPYEHLREELKLNNAPVYQIYLHTKRKLRKEYHVQDFEKGNPDIEINTDKNPHACWLELKSELNNII